MAQWLGLDIGGANLKAADESGQAVSRPFPLWQRPAELAAEITALLAEFPNAECVAVTMTGELADCYASKKEGVERISAAVSDAAAHRDLAFYLVGGAWATAAEATQRWQRAAASNWHALASWAGAHLGHGNVRGDGLLIDVGSTTTDLIPIVDSRPAAHGTTDVTRMMHGELIYSGVSRTPVCGLGRHLIFRGSPVDLAHEFFATMADVYLLLGRSDEDPLSAQTADGRPLTQAAAAARLARCLCCDTSEVTREELLDLARQLAAVQRQSIFAALERVLSGARFHPAWVIAGGEGEFLADEIIRHRLPSVDVHSLADSLGPMTSRCAAAFAVAQLASRQVEAV